MFEQIVHVSEPHEVSNSLEERKQCGSEMLKSTFSSSKLSLVMNVELMFCEKE